MFYEFECDSCHLVTTRDIPIKKAQKYILCQCGKRSHLIISKPTIFYEGNFFAMRDNRNIYKKY
jgi:hypothetical protein